MSWVAIAIGGSAILGVGASMYGASKQADAIESAAQSTENWQKYLIALETKKYDEAARFRDLAFQEANLKVGALRETMPLLKEDILRKPGTSALFKEGVAGLSANLAPYGLSPGSSTFGKGVGQLMAQDVENIRNDRFRLAGFGTTGINPETGYPNMGQAGQAQSDISNLIGMKGAVQGGMYGSIGQTISQLPLLYNTMNQSSGGYASTYEKRTPVNYGGLLSGGI